MHMQALEALRANKGHTLVSSKSKAQGTYINADPVLLACVGFRALPSHQPTSLSVVTGPH